MVDAVDRALEDAPHFAQVTTRKGGTTGYGERNPFTLRAEVVTPTPISIDGGGETVANTGKQVLHREVAENAELLGAMRDDAGSGAPGNSAVSTDLQRSVDGLISAKGTQIGPGAMGARGSDGRSGRMAEGLAWLGNRGLGTGAPGSGFGKFWSKGEGGTSAVGGDLIVLGIAMGSYPFLFSPL